MTSHPQDLSWISFAKLVSIAERYLKTTLKRLVEEQNSRPEPTSVLVRAVLLDKTFEEVRELDNNAALLGTLRTNIGNFHEAILGSVAGWEHSGKKGGVIDLYSNDRVPLAADRYVVAEVKMRYNTIKGSDERATHDRLRDAYRSRGGGSECVSYIFQIVPPRDEPTDEPWVVSGRNPDPNVRRADGATAYHLVTGDPNAFYDLFKILPDVFVEAFERIRTKQRKKNPSYDFVNIKNNVSAEFIQRALEGTIPSSSALKGVTS